MTKFAQAFNNEWELELTDEKLRRIAGEPQFQNVISDLLHNLEAS